MNVLLSQDVWRQIVKDARARARTEERYSFGWTDPRVVHELNEIFDVGGQLRAGPVQRVEPEPLPVRKRRDWLTLPADLCIWFVERFILWERD